MVKNPPAMQEPQERWVQSLGREDLLQEEMPILSSILEQRIPWTEEPGGLLSIGSQSRTQLKWLSMHACTGEENGNPLQYSCLENPKDGGAWWAAVYGVAQSWTWLKQLSSSSSRQYSCLEKIPWTEEPGGLQSMGLQRVGHDWAT